MKQIENEYDDMAYKSIIELIEVFAKQGHSGSSAAYCISKFNILAKFGILSPLTGEDSEWRDVSVYSGEGGEPKYQNIRYSRVFKESNGRCYDIEAVIFEDDAGDRFTNRKSIKDVEFPYYPKKIIKRVKSRE